MWAAANLWNDSPPRAKTWWSASLCPKSTPLAACVLATCAAPVLIGPLRRINPPWAVGLPGQLAAVTALQNPDYYRQKYAETHALRRKLAENLSSFGDMSVIPGSANFLFLEIPGDGPSSDEVIARCREHNLFLRNPAATTPRLGEHSLRIAVKDSATNLLMTEILGEALAGP